MGDFKLLSCPFCGGEAKTYAERNEETKYGPHGWTSIIRPPIVAVGCEMCGYNLPFRDSFENAASAWNTRTTPPEK